MQGVKFLLKVRNISSIILLASRVSDVAITLSKIIKLGLQSIHNCHRYLLPIYLFPTESGSKYPSELISYIEFLNFK